MIRALVRATFWTGVAMIIFVGPYVLAGLLGLPSV